MTKATIAILGAGSWGTALGILLCRNGHAVKLWGHDAEHINFLQRQGENRQFLPGFALPLELTATASLETALAESTDCFIVVPSQFFSLVARAAAPYLVPELGVVWATKGLEVDTGRLLHHLAVEALGSNRTYAVVSGPSFAREVARGLPTAVTVAAQNPDFGTRIARLLHGGNFRAYTSNDLIGVEICGAAKNVLAIATGIADGLGFGANTRAALITRGLAELMRLGTALGGRAETFTGLAGIGDLVLTCTDDQSRNRRLGLALASGKTIQEAQSTIGQEIEGLITARALRRLAQQLNIELPISEQVYRVLYEGVLPLQATQALLSRDPRAEF